MITGLHAESNLIVKLVPAMAVNRTVQRIISDHLPRLIP